MRHCRWSHSGTRHYGAEGILATRFGQQDLHKPSPFRLANLNWMEPAGAAVTITIHVIEIVGVAIAVVLYLLIKLWRRI
jgi:hypothetical protein